MRSKNESCDTKIRNHDPSACMVKSFSDSKQELVNSGTNACTADTAVCDADSFIKRASTCIPMHSVDESTRYTKSIVSKALTVTVSTDENEKLLTRYENKNGTIKNNVYIDNEQTTVDFIVDKASTEVLEENREPNCDNESLSNPKNKTIMFKQFINITDELTNSDQSINIRQAFNTECINYKNVYETEYENKQTEYKQLNKNELCDSTGKINDNTLLKSKYLSLDGDSDQGSPKRKKHCVRSECTCDLLSENFDEITEFFEHVSDNNSTPSDDTLYDIDELTQCEEVNIFN